MSVQRSPLFVAPVTDRLVVTIVTTVRYAVLTVTTVPHGAQIEQLAMSARLAATIATRARRLAARTVMSVPHVVMIATHVRPAVLIATTVAHSHVANARASIT